MLFSEPKISQTPQFRACGEGSSVFQCSSASRKFLKPMLFDQLVAAGRFQCSSASRKFLKQADDRANPAPVRFQCSSASRKFLKRPTLQSRLERTAVSVLFSEPKISQITVIGAPSRVKSGFSALQRAENFSKHHR